MGAKVQFLFVIAKDFAPFFAFDLTFRQSPLDIMSTGGAAVS